MSEKSENYIGTIGMLKKAIVGLPDDAVLYTQIVSENGDCWHLPAFFGEALVGKPKAYCLTLRHPHMSRLPDFDSLRDNQEQGESDE